MPRLLTPPASLTCRAAPSPDTVRPDTCGPDAVDGRRSALAAPERLAALRLCTGRADDADGALAGVVRRAVAALRAPFGLVSRVEVDRDRWLAVAGVPDAVAAAGETRARPSFCEEVVVTGGPVVVEDALADPHFAGFPAVRDFGVRACLGAPLVAAGGQVVGSLCVLDTEPRAWSADDVAAVRELAAAAAAVLERDAARATLRDVMEGGLDSTYLMQSVRDPGGRIVDFVFADCNARAAVQVGLPSREALIGRRWRATFRTPRARLMTDAYARVVETGEPYEAEFAVSDPRIAARGTTWLRLQAARVGDGVAVTSQDISASKATEAALREGETRYRSLVESLPVVVYRAQPHPPYAPLYVSAGAAAYGYSLEEWLGSPDLWVRILHPDDRERVLAETGAALDGGRPVDYEYRIVARDGAVHWVHDRGDFARDADGRAVAWQGILLDVTDRRRAEAEREAATRATAEREAHFRALLEHAQDVIGVIAADGTILYESPAITRVLGARPEDMVGRQSFDFVHRDDRPGLAVQFAALLATPGARSPVRYRCRHTDGGWRLLEGEAWNLVDHPVVGGVVVNMRDVTERERAAAALRESESRLRQALDAANDGLWDWHVPTGAAYYSPRWTAMLGYAEGDVPARFDAFRDLLHPDDAPRVQAALDGALGAPEGARADEGTPDFALEYRLRARDGAWYWVLGRGDVVERDPAGRPVRMAGTHVDINERKALEAALVRQATHDALTGLASREHFRARVDAALARAALAQAVRAEADGAADDGRGVVVLFLDLDDFKAVNDSLGHAAGDALLKVAAGRLLNATRGCDTVARLGGDEFAVLLDGQTCDAESQVVADRIAGVLARPFAVAGRQVCTRGSVGIARATAGDDADALLRNADLAMYRAKAQGQGRVAVFAPAMHAAVVDRVALAEDLRRVTDWQCEGAPDFGAREAAGEFSLVYQPIVGLGDGRTGGAEALFRWRHPSRGFVSPAECIPLAEETGLIVPIGRWVLETACREAAGWPGEGFVTVNVSARQLQQSSFVAEVGDVLAAAGLPARRLVVEITEGVLMQRTDETLARLHALKALGVRLAVDDFGTGYSSLAYLQRFPLDVLKLDKAFVDPLARGGAHVALARTVLALGESLGLRTVAEGVETAEQWEALQALGCGWGQGYLFARPLAAEAMRERARAERRLGDVRAVGGRAGVGRPRGRER